MGNRILANYIAILIGQKVTDVTTGLKGWTRNAIEQIAFQDDAYSYEAEIVVRAGLLGQRILEIPVSYASRVAGVSMHTSDFKLTKAGIVIILKCFTCWIRTLFTRKKRRAGAS
jgi:hypothetical protein